MCLFKSLSIYIDAFLYLMKKKIICLPTYPNFSDRVGSGETKIFLNLARLSLYRGPPVNVPIGRTAHCVHVILESDTKRSMRMFRHQIFLALVGIEPGTSSIRGGNGSFRPRVVSALSRFGPGSFRPGSFRPGSIRSWVVSAQFGGSFRPINFFLNYQACYQRSTKYIFG